MKKILFILLVCSLLLQCGCASLTTPPTIEEVTERFYDQQQYIQIVADYICSCEYNSMSFTASDTVRVDVPGTYKLNEVSIEDDTVRNAVKQLLKEYHSISLRYNTIRLSHGYATLGGLESGISYSVDPNALPYLDYGIELNAIDDTGWYYYVQDYDNYERTPVRRKLPASALPRATGTVLLSHIP